MVLKLNGKHMMVSASCECRSQTIIFCEVSSLLDYPMIFSRSTVFKVKWLRTDLSGTRNPNQLELYFQAKPSTDTIQMSKE